MNHKRLWGAVSLFVLIILGVIGYFSFEGGRFKGQTLTDEQTENIILIGSSKARGQARDKIRIPLEENEKITFFANLQKEFQTAGYKMKDLEWKITPKILECDSKTATIIKCATISGGSSQVSVEAVVTKTGQPDTAVTSNTIEITAAGEVTELALDCPEVETAPDFCTDGSIEEITGPDGCPIAICRNEAFLCRGYQELSELERLTRLRDDIDELINCLETKSEEEEEIEGEEGEGELDEHGCPIEFDPVCGAVDGARQLFVNICQAEVVGASDITEGACDTELDKETESEDPTNFTVEVEEEE